MFHGYRLSALLIFPLILCLSGCDDPVAPTAPAGPTGFFSGSQEIIVNYPHQDVPLTESDLHVDWDPIGQVYVTISIFRVDAYMNYDNNFISNDTDAVWIWTTGKIAGVSGHVDFMDGSPVDDGTPRFDSPPHPLSPGNHYALVIWVWDRTGTRIEKSSKKIRFTINIA